jgi:hypothetical protein
LRIRRRRESKGEQARAKEARAEQSID